MPPPFQLSLRSDCYFAANGVAGSVSVHLFGSLLPVTLQLFVRQANPNIRLHLHVTGHGRVNDLDSGSFVKHSPPPSVTASPHKFETSSGIKRAGLAVGRPQENLETGSLLRSHSGTLVAVSSKPRPYRGLRSNKQCTSLRRASH